MDGLRTVLGASDTVLGGEKVYPKHVLVVSRAGQGGRQRALSEAGGCSCSARALRTGLPLGVCQMFWC